jgi:serine/threonine protein kinase
MDLKETIIHGGELHQTILEIVKSEDLQNLGALKELHNTKDARDPDEERAEERIKNEIKVMQEIKHPNLLEILDSNPDGRWFVSEYHPFGTLDQALYKYSGDIKSTLKAFRPIVEAVAELHNNGVVHRDIKPHNIFIGVNNNLILGDFGLVFLREEDKTRISPVFENLGSRDWMPGWAQGIRIEDVTNSFDVFSLGKVLWSMLSGEPKLQLWYFDRNDNNLEDIFPNDSNMVLVNSLLKKCIVEEEKGCLEDANQMLTEGDRILKVLSYDADIINIDITRPCKVCGLGEYELIVNNDYADLKKMMGISLESGQHFRILSCNNCGHVQFFRWTGDEEPNAWK